MIPKSGYRFSDKIVLQYNDGLSPVMTRWFDSRGKISDAKVTTPEC